MEKIMPIIVTTMPALDNALKEKYKLIYLDNSLYYEMEQKMAEILRRNQYECVQTGNRGVFFQRISGPGTRRVCKDEIADLLQIL